MHRVLAMTARLTIALVTTAGTGAITRVSKDTGAVAIRNREWLNALSVLIKCELKPLIIIIV